MEVWFDRDELVGGDAWDQKIRRQIKTCALFIPLISANTNARAEGYFRLEWKLAVDRSHLMADDAPFLLPVVIDDIAETAARVPDRFREVQWTRLDLKDTPESLAARVARSLRADAPDPGRPPGRSPRNIQPRDSDGASSPARDPAMRRVYIIFGLIVSLFFIVRLWWTHEDKPSPKSAQTVPVHPPTPPAPPVSEARQLAVRARALSVDKYNSKAEDYAAAETMLKRALELDPGDAEIWATASLLNFLYTSRGFDRSPARGAAAHSFAERALTLDPNSVSGLFALGRWQFGYDDATIAEGTFRRVLVLDPNYPGALMALGQVCDRRNEVEEAAALFDRAALQPSLAPLVYYNKFLLYFQRGLFEQADVAVRRSIELAPSAVSDAGLAMLKLTWKGDTAGAADVLAKGRLADRVEPRIIWVTALVQLCQRDSELALKTIGRFPGDYIQDNWFSGPKSYLVGRAHALAGRTAAARLAWEAALAMVDTRLKATNDNLVLHVTRGELLARLGEVEEARRELRVVIELGRGDELPWFVSPARISTALGDADQAVPILREQLAHSGRNVGWPLTTALLRLDPLWDNLRGQPAFDALLVEPPAASR